ncbi:MAG: C40 family peptidase [Oscillospiraceae bacterium]|jgi:cell wall-associated NlpC family hydrolase|nr:C40 family peptidase [Oscillospiraceae bacterium]
MNISHIKSAVAPVYVKPDERAELADEVLHGMEVTVTETAGEWCLIQTYYGYGGYVRAVDIEEESTYPEIFRTHEKLYVISSFSDVKAERSYQSSSLVTLPRGSIVAAEAEGAGNAKEDAGVGAEPTDGWRGVVLADGRSGYVRASSLSASLLDMSGGDEDALREAIVSLAKEYLGVQYRWGGKTPLGIDCSGLCSAVYLMCGIIIYRDARIEDGFSMRKIGKREVKKGDLIYFSGHVAMYIGEERYIHATGRAGSDGVVINSLNPAHDDYREDLAKGILYYGSAF